MVTVRKAEVKNAKFGLIYDNEKSIELFKNKPIDQLQLISVNKLDNIDSLDFIFIIPTKDVTKEECEKLRQNHALKVIIAPRRYDHLNKISNSYIEQEINQEGIYNSVEQIVKTMAIPSLVGLDFADIKEIFKDNEIMKIFLLKIDCNKRSRIKSLIEKTVMNDIFVRNQCNCFLAFEGGNDMTLNHMNSILSILETQLGDESVVVYAANVQKELKGKIKLYMFIGKKSSLKNNAK